MQHAVLDNSKVQYALYGNQIKEVKPYEPLKMSETSLLRHLVGDMVRSGRHEEAMDMLCATIEEMQKDIQEMKKNGL